MANLLFRAKAINRDIGYHRTKYKNGDWVYGLITRLYDERFPNLSAEMTDENGVSRIEVDYKTVGQYTGLTDKNGVKIFDGDVIIAYHNGKFMNTSYIIYDAPEYLCELISGINIDMVDSLSDYHDEYAIEVVGNVHDNPELIMVKLAEDDFLCASIICELCKKFNTDECKPVADCSCFELRYADDVK